MTETTPNLPAPPGFVRMLGVDWRVERYERDHQGWPMMIARAPDGGPPVMAFVAGDYLGFFTGHVIDRSGVPVIAKVDIDRLAAILNTKPTQGFEFDVNQVALGFAALIVRGFHSPKFLRDFASALERNPEATIEKYRNDRFVSLIIARISHDVAEILRQHPFWDRAPMFRKACRHLRDEMRKLSPPGGVTDRPMALFHQTLVLIARRLGCDCKLPARDRSRGGLTSTPLLAFATVMQDLLIAQGQALGATKRFDRLEPPELIAALERARAAVNAENPLISICP
jgi:hypothetical protein